jgi:hypothetical protein
MSKNLQHSKEKTKTFNIQKQEHKPSTSLKARTFNLFKCKYKNLQLPRAKTKAFNLSKSKNKNLQPPRPKTKAHKHKRMKVVDALGQIC